MRTWFGVETAHPAAIHKAELPCIVQAQNDALPNMSMQVLILLCESG